MGAIEHWAWQEFGRAELGDERRTRRAVEIAARAAEWPSGRITDVVRSAAEQEAAFRLVRNSSVCSRALARSSHEACLERCGDRSVFFVAVDQTSLGLTDRTGEKDLGPVGSRSGARVRGVQAMTALAISEQGRVLGVCAQRWWRRSDEKSPPWERDRRPVSERETSLWHDVISDVECSLAKVGGRSRPWYQLDRAGDCWHLLDKAAEQGLLITVRAAYDRVLFDKDHRRLRAAVAAEKPLGTFEHHLSAAAAKRAGHSHRRARHLQLRARRVTLKLTDWKNHKGHLNKPATYWVVHVREKHPPSGAERLEWFLLTTHPVESLTDARKVVRGYTLRWRVEEFHKTWKSGACNVESSQLRSCDNFCRWATILAAVASRIERLKHVARNQPDTPAIEVATRDEIDGAIVLTPRCNWKTGDSLSADQFVQLVARIGGYTGKSSGGPPGSIVIGRGLNRVAAAATALAAVRATGKM